MPTLPGNNVPGKAAMHSKCTKYKHVIPDVIRNKHTNYLTQHHMTKHQVITIASIYALLRKLPEEVLREFFASLTAL